MKALRNFTGENSRRLKLPALTLAAATLLCAGNAHAVGYAGNGDGGFGGPIGEGTMTFTDDGTNISGTVLLGGNQQFNDVLVLYVDNGAGGGFSDTSGFTDSSDGNRSAIAGVQGSQRSVMTFMSGFAPQYAVALAPSATGFGGIWKLINGTNFPYYNSANLSPINNSGPYTFSFSCTNFGLIPGSKTSLKIFGTYLGTSAYRSTEALPGDVSRGQGQGWFPFTQTAYSSYTFAAGSPTLTPVTFQVDLSEQVANGSFTPGTSTITAAGTFQSNPWSGFPLTNTPINGNPYIYSGTYLDSNPTNTAEQFKFVINGSTYEGTDNRRFTLQPGAQTLPLVYFNDLYLMPSATTNYVTFKIDMSPWIALGNFNPSTQTIQVFGTFENPQWTEGGFILTNALSGPNTNIYSGTYPDGNYPGSFEDYKFVIVSGPGSDTYEGLANNRTFYTPTNSGTLPLAYFQNVSNVVTVPVTFQVDMTAPIAAGLVNLASGDTVGAAGTFQSPQGSGQWVTGASGFILTNNPTSANSNLFTGTYNVTQQPGTAENYKFIINSVANGTIYESPATTGGNNRLFLLSSNAQILPAVYWADQDPNNVLLQATTITFTVNMTNAVDVSNVPFNPQTDAVFINGTFTTPQYALNWTDPLPSSDYPQYQLTEVGSSLLYTGTFSVAPGTPLQVTYKYGIYHNAGSINSGTLDNEAPFGQNHSRYIRTVGAYSFPTDIFGQQVTNSAAANEISFGNLTVNRGTPGTAALTWLGRPGVYLQVSTNLASGKWVTLTNSSGLSATNISTSGSNAGFYRLVNP